MDIFNVLTMIGGLSLFLFGMSIMGQSLERRAGGRLRGLLGKLTTNKLAGLMTGLGITAAIQSSSATTVMVVGFVNSGLMTLRQAIHVIMGANVGTTVTAWILSLAGINSSGVFVRLLKPTSFTPILALAGIIQYMFCKSDTKKDSGMILLGFATLMTGMETMSGAVSGLRDDAGFQELFLVFQNPLLGVAAGAVLTAIIQSSSASVGILQALAVSGRVTYGAAIPIVMGQNIGTCITAMLSAVGANKNAKRAAAVHLTFNVLGTAGGLAAFWLVKSIGEPAFLTQPASLLGIAAAHSVFNALCTIVILPFTGSLERLVMRLVPDASEPEQLAQLDERLLSTPAIAMECAHTVAADMAQTAAAALREGILSLYEYSPQLASCVREKEDKTDQQEDTLGTYLVKLSGRQISEADREDAAKLLKEIGDFERIADHGVNLSKAAQRMQDKSLTFSTAAISELRVLTAAVEEALDLALAAFLQQDQEAALEVEALEQVIDRLKEKLYSRHILRMQQGECTIDAGFIWADLLTSLQRTKDHCLNIAGYVMDADRHELYLHEYKAYMDKYTLPNTGKE